jgi:surface antigen Omp85-like protein
VISDGLLADMRRLVGQNLAYERAEGILRRLRRELRPTRIVSKRVTRGNDRDHVRIIYEVERAPFFGFQKFGNYALYHSKQGPSFALEVGFGSHNNRFSFGILNDGNQLLERDQGFRLAFENRRAGTEHLGFRIDYFDYRQIWKESTQLALELSPDVPGIYRERRGVEPTLTFAPDPRVRFNAGVSISELQMQFPQIHFQNVNAGTATVTYKDNWEDAGRHDHHLTASYNLRAASNNLDSDFIYTRHFGDVNYRFDAHHSEFVASFMAGTVNGNPPLFDRLSLGNASTLRGWNKYDLDPIGGNRMLYGSLEYRFTVLQLFYDVGSVWDKGQAHETSHSLGFGLHGRGNDNWFLTFGVPIRSGHIQPLKPLFMMGVHF